MFFRISRQNAHIISSATRLPAWYSCNQLITACGIETQNWQTGDPCTFLVATNLLPLAVLKQQVKYEYVKSPSGCNQLITACGIETMFRHTMSNSV